jgi:hypothetical protein
MSNHNYFEGDYLPKMHKIGKTIGVIAILISFAPALVLGLVYGLWPNWGALATCMVSAAASFAFLWFIEPISYYPVVGPVGTYMAFVSGNISNMRIPCASMAQVSAGVEPGTNQGSIIATIGMGTSIIINVAILTVGVIGGQAILSALPESVTAALNYLLPALFGALFVQFGMKNIKLSGIVLVLACVLYVAINAGVFNFIPGASNWLGTLVCVFGAIGIAVLMSKGDKKKA